MFFKYPFNAKKFRKILDEVLNMQYKEFAEISKATGKSWVSRLLKVDGDLSFAASSRALLGYSLRRYERLNEFMIVEDGYKTRAKAELLDQLIEEMREVVKIGGHGANKDLIRKQKKEKHENSNI